MTASPSSLPTVFRRWVWRAGEAILERVRTSYLVVPSIGAVSGVFFAWLTLWFDARAVSFLVEDHAFIFRGSPDSARIVISTLTGAMITIVGCVFSLTLLSLTVASSQFGPRLIRTFMRDSTTQLAIACFLGTFSTLVTVLVGMSSSNVAHVSVTFAVAMTSISVGMLIFFVHHVASFLRVPSIIATISQRFDEIVDDLLADRELDDAAEVTQRPKALPLLVHATHSGYVQSVDHALLARVARDRRLVIRTLVRAGHHVLAGSALAECSDERDDSETAETLRDAFLIGNERTDAQDIEHPIRQLVEIALRALSPGINDPFTATACIDRLGVLVARLADKRMPRAVNRGLDQHSQLTTVGTTFEGICDLAFNQIRQAAADKPAIAIRMLETLAALDAVAGDDEAQRDVFRRHAERIRAAADGTTDERDRAEIAAAFQRAVDRPDMAAP